MEKLPIIIIAGPTAGGKTKVSVALAKKINGEIISADSMQIYKYMDIGTAKITKDEMQGIPHYLIDELEPDEAYSVAEFQKRGRAHLHAIAEKGKTPIIVGGTGFYINALLYDNQFTETEKDDKFREKLYALAKEKGSAYIHSRLNDVDPEAAAVIHQNNIKRVIRALEFYEQTNLKISDHNKEEQLRTSNYAAEIAILSVERPLLYQRIEARVDEMLRTGLVDEVRGLLARGYARTLVSMQGIGYKEIVCYLENEIDFDTAVSELKKATRHFAKRQLTWFHRQIEGAWYDVSSFENADALAAEIAGAFLKSVKTAQSAYI
ncbi:MAG: tRNA (adenosine(37)-N6)-dimethylallyltransferase MiaA [Clostridiales bacterium]|jgi:tRNA dimethylallyltransferase|nr:tRNA (adenosine(37)-N6)-dimethylallyltransferase MiaA [Clostridiales bacterium]